MDESLDSSSAKLPYELDLPIRLEALAPRATGGSAVKSQDPPSSSMEDNDAYELDGGFGGNMRSRIWLCKHLGIGMDS